jgi:hypothetical protein
MIILLFVMDRIDANKSNKNHSAIRLVMFNYKHGENIVTDRLTPMPLGPGAVIRDVPTNSSIQFDIVKCIRVYFMTRMVETDLCFPSLQPNL